MGLVNRAIPALIGGVSQQPAPVRHASQVDECENMLPSVVDGLRSRPGSYFWNKLANDNQWTDAFVHWFENERGWYFMMINNAMALKVFNADGVEVPVAAPNGLNYIQVPSTLANYLPARSAFKAVTVADSTFLINRYVTVAREAAAPTTIHPRLFVVIKVGVIKTEYSVTLDGTKYAYTSGDATATPPGTDTQEVANALASAINGGGTFTATVSGNLITIAKLGDADFTYSYADSYGNNGMFAFKDEVNRYEELPRQFVENRTIKVNGDPNNANSAWYVRWKKDASGDDGVWIETTAPNLQNVYDKWTMPWRLVQQPDGTFVFDYISWAPRETGDENSNPPMSFLDHTITDVFFHRNRLGFLSDENVILSQAGDYFNLWAASARAVLDSDPIDISAETTEVALLNHVVPFDKSLLLFSNRQQFLFEGGETLTPRTAKIVPTTAFASFGPKPAIMGRNVFFTTFKGNYANVREYYYDGGTVTNDAVDTTLHCPTYIPINVSRVVAVPAEDMVVIQQVDDRSVLYVYNTYWNGEEKVQSAWHKWRFHPGDRIVSVGVRGSMLAIVVERDDGLYLDRLEVSSVPYSPTSYEIKLDRWVGFANGLYDSSQGMTFWTLPYAVPDGATVRVITTKRTGDLGQGLVATLTGPSTVGVKGDYRDTEVVIGIEFDSWFRFSKQFNSDGKDAPVITDRIQIRDFVVSFTKTGYFEATVLAAGRDPRTYIYSGRKLGLVDMLIGQEVIESGSYKIPVMARNTEVDVEIHNHTHLPCRFVSAEWQGHIAMQARR